MELIVHVDLPVFKRAVLYLWSCENLCAGVRDKYHMFGLRTACPILIMAWARST